MTPLKSYPTCNFLAAALVIAGLAGCADTGPPPAEPPPRSAGKVDEPPIRPVERPMNEPTGGGAASKNRIELPRSLLTGPVADLSSRLGAAEADITVHTAIPVTWNDGAVGCPEPGMAYSQALVPGYWVVLKHGGRLYSYHAARNAKFRLCETARPDPAGRPPGGRYDSDT